MSFNRIKYDNTAYDLQMGRSVAPGDYRLFESFAENPNQCFSYDGPTGSKSDVSLARSANDLTFMAQVESELSWRHQPLSKDNITTPISSFKLVHKPVCTNQLSGEDTRFTNPIVDFRSMSLTDYQLEPYLHINPQCNIQEINDRVGLNSRSWAKDMYKDIPQVVWDNNEALPKEVKSYIAKCNM
jgi:hypothetical protein